MTEKRPTLQEAAMRYGTAMGIFWTLKFVLFPMGMKMPLLLMLFFLLTLAVPFLGYRFARNFRERYCGGVIGFGRAFMFTAFMYMFAALFATIIHYVYFRFIDNGLIVNTYYDMLNQLSAGATGELQASIDQIRSALDVVAQLTPVEISLQLISQNIFYCVIIALFTALVVMRSQKKE